MAGEKKEENEGNRKWGCNYSASEHERAARDVCEKAPQVFEWVKKYGGFRDFGDSLLSGQGYAMEVIFWQLIAETLPSSTLVDKGDVLIALREIATPMSDHDKKWLLDVSRRSEEQKKKSLPSSE